MFGGGFGFSGVTHTAVSEPSPSTLKLATTRFRLLAVPAQVACRPATLQATFVSAGELNGGSGIRSSSRSARSSGVSPVDGNGADPHSTEGQTGRHPPFALISIRNPTRRN